MVALITTATGSDSSNVHQQTYGPLCDEILLSLEKEEIFDLLYLREYKAA